MRHVILDEGRRLLWVTAFETDWDPYIDDSVDILGVQAWIDWLQHTVEWRDEVGESHCAMKDFIQSAQVKAAWYFNALADLTMDEIRRPCRCSRPSSRSSTTRPRSRCSRSRSSRRCCASRRSERPARLSAAQSAVGGWPR
jgi:hypothetical protein